MPEIFGAIDSMSSLRIQGWARSNDLHAAIHFAITLDGKVVAEGAPRIDRPDIGGVFGFDLHVETKLSSFDRLTGRVKVTASSAALAISRALKPSVEERRRLLKELARDCRSILQAGDLAALLNELRSDEGQASEQLEPTAPHLADRAAMSALLKTLPSSTRQIEGAQISAPVNVPIGHISPDGTAVIGLGGYIYLVGGSNAVLKLQLSDANSSSVSKDVAGWTNIMQRRIAFCKGIGVSYLQTILPEKINVLPEFFPYELPIVSPRLAAIEKNLAGASTLDQVYVSGIKVLRNTSMPFRAKAFPKTDSHFSSAANYVLFTALLERMGLFSPFGVFLSQLRSNFVGDLAKRFFGIPLYDEVDFPTGEYVDSISNGLTLSEAFNPPTGHINSRYVWTNTKAPFPFKVVAFANSFFERGGDPRCLSWWFARSFKEFHFVWNPNLDEDYVAQHKPDWVVCQSIERFLNVVPKS